MLWSLGGAGEGRGYEVFADLKFKMGKDLILAFCSENGLSDSPDLKPKEEEQLKSCEQANAPTPAEQASPPVDADSAKTPAEGRTRSLILNSFSVIENGFFVQT